MILFTVFLIFLLLGAPIAFSMGFGSLISILTSPYPNLIIIPKRLAYGVNTFQLLAVPFFMLAGELMNHAKITDRIFDLAMCFVGHFRGGLGHVNIVASMIFAGMTGSGLADAAGLGKVEIEAMLKAKYDPKFSAAVTASSAIIGPIIPPSIPMILAAALTDTSAGKLLIGGFIPGVVMGLGLMLVVFVRARRRNYPREPRANLKKFWEAIRKGFWPLWTPVIIIGGMLSGIFTATEAAAVAVLYAIILGCIVYREIKIKQLWQIIVNTGINCSIILFILCTASIMTEIITRSGLAVKFLEVIFQITQNPQMIFFLIILLFLILGFFLIDLAIMVMLAPLLAPAVVQLGIDPVHFAIVMVVCLMLAMITPPVGSIMYVVCHYTGITIGQFTKEMIPFYLILLTVIITLMLFPRLCLFLPNLLIK
jgi:tripartite ATP-independent transporter DctM subunit